MTRQIILDTETTGMSPIEGHRVIEIGCLEMINRRLTGKHFHCYINPERNIDAEALSVHGITEDFLRTQPLFKTIADDFLAFITGAELIIHNAPFDVGFLNHELNTAGKKYGKILNHCQVLDTLPLARQLHPGQRNNLDALCKRYGVNNSHRDLHGALLDAELLAFVYLAMTGGQTTLFSEEITVKVSTETSVMQSTPIKIEKPLRVIRANDAELTAHQERLKAIVKKTGSAIWDKLENHAA